jgi:hypothetical protein
MFWIQSLFNLSTKFNDEVTNEHFTEKRLLVVITKNGLLLLQVIDTILFLLTQLNK